MSDNDNIEFDDVEGHGLKEVAAGLGVAAVVVGGAGASLVAHSSSADTATARVPSVSVNLDDPMGTVDRTTDWGVATTRAARDTALTTAVRTANDTTRLAGNTVRQADRTVQDTEHYAIDTADELVTAAKTDVSNTVDTAGTIARSTVDTAATTVHSTLSTVRQTVNDLDVSVGAGVSDDGVDASASAAGHNVGGHVG
ncbi:MAG: hypothetical protein QOJ79_1759 [Actinomycetota bacterium]|jgi:hypothetical protein|nr:hypothetical protein [Actinomycetota bacterium]